MQQQTQRGVAVAWIEKSVSSVFRRSPVGCMRCSDCKAGVCGHRLLACWLTVSVVCYLDVWTCRRVDVCGGALRVAYVCVCCVFVCSLLQCVLLFVCSVCVCVCVFVRGVFVYVVVCWWSVSVSVV